MLGISFMAKSCSTVLFLIAWWFYRPVKDASHTVMDPIRIPPSSALPLSRPIEAYDPPPSAHMGYDNPALSYDNAAAEVT